MKSHLEKLSLYEKKIWEIREVVISNIVLIGQIPAPTFGEEERVKFFMDRMADFQVDECAADDRGNAVRVIEGASKTSKPIYLVTNLDTSFKDDAMCDYIVTEKAIKGPGVRHNSTAAGVLLSLPEIFRRLDLVFDSDIVMVGSIESLGRGNQMGIRRLLQSRTEPARGAICLETAELGAIGCHSDGRIRGEIECATRTGAADLSDASNAVTAVNEVINRMREVRLPEKPLAGMDIGTLSGGVIDDENAYKAAIGFEIFGESDGMTRGIFSDVRNIVNSVDRRFDVELKLNRISELNAARISSEHPLVQCAGAVLNRLGIEAVEGPSANAQSIFLSRGTPAITLALTHGSAMDQKDEMVEIEPIYKGISQVLGVLTAMDGGVCNE